MVASGIEGAHFGPFAILETLATSSTATVYRARQAHPRRDVALKVFHGASPADLARFRNEASVVARLRHPHIVALYEVGESDGSPWLALEYIAGHDLAQLLAAQALTRESRLRCVEEAASAVHFAHQHGILHRDLKPANVLVTREGHALVTDFGLARDTASGASLTRTGEALGTPAYMAPEQVRGRPEEITCATDVYGLGSVLYQVLTGLPPFTGANAFALMQQVLHVAPMPPRALDKSIAADLEAIALKCLAKDPRERYASAADLASDLSRHRHGQPVQARKASLLRRAALAARRNPALIAATIAVAAALLAGVTSILRIHTARTARAAADARAQRDRAFADVRGGLAGFRHLQVMPALAAIARDGDPRERAEKLIELAALLRQQRVHEPALELAARAVIAAQESRDSELADLASELCALAQADLGDFAAALATVAGSAGDRCRRLSALLAPLVPGLRTLDSGAPAATERSQICLVAGDIDGDAAAELLSIWADPLDPAGARAVLYAFRPATSPLSVVLPAGPLLESAHLVDLNGDGCCELWLNRNLGDARTLAEAYEFEQLDRLATFPCFRDVFVSAVPQCTFAHDFGGSPGYELIVACGPNRRTCVWYSAAEPFGFPNPRSRKALDPSLEALDTDVSFVTALECAGSAAPRQIALGTTGHVLFELRSYVMEEGEVCLFGRLPLGRVSGLLAASPTDTLCAVSATPLDPRLDPAVDRKLLRESSILVLSNSRANRTAIAATGHLPRSVLAANFELPRQELRVLSQLTAPSDAAPVYSVFVHGEARYSHFDVAHVTSIALFQRGAAEFAACVLASPTAELAADLDGDGDREIAAVSGGRICVVGLTDHAAPITARWPRVEAQSSFRMWTDLLRPSQAGEPRDPRVAQFAAALGGLCAAATSVSKATHVAWRSARDFGAEPDAIPIPCPTPGFAGRAANVEFGPELAVAMELGSEPHPDLARSLFRFTAVFAVDRMQYGTAFELGIFAGSQTAFAMRLAHLRLPNSLTGSRHAVAAQGLQGTIKVHQVDRDREFDEDLWYRCTITGDGASGEALLELRPLDWPEDAEPFARCVLLADAPLPAGLVARARGWSENPLAEGRARILLQRMELEVFDRP